MIVVTGGAGFIGSAIVWQLNQRGITDIIIVDHLASSEKWKNLVGLTYDNYYDRLDFITRLEQGLFGTAIRAIIHLGACSATTESNSDYLMENNFRYTQRLGAWWEKNQAVRFIYASSAATYGDGAQGYVDDESALQDLRPLNMYGYSKHMFDLYARSHGWLSRIVGLKFFNVYGPNEYHKEDMRSVMNKAFARVRDEGVMALFKSYNPQYRDGEQRRDFIYIKDAVTMALFFLDNPAIGGIFNIGTGTARSWNDVAHALFAALQKKGRIDYIPMPESIRDKYQYLTQAQTDKLKQAGCTHAPRSLEDAIADYAGNYLSAGRHLAW